jgi:hypothetical protein
MEISFADNGNTTNNIYFQKGNNGFIIPNSSFSKVSKLDIKKKIPNNNSFLFLFYCSRYPSFNSLRKSKNIQYRDITLSIPIPSYDKTIQNHKL